MLCFAQIHAISSTACALHSAFATTDAVPHRGPSFAHLHLRHNSSSSDSWCMGPSNYHLSHHLLAQLWCRSFSCQLPVLHLIKGRHAGYGKQLLHDAQCCFGQPDLQLQLFKRRRYGAQLRHCFLPLQSAQQCFQGPYPAAANLVAACCTCPAGW